MAVYYMEEKNLHKKDENDDLRAQITQDVMKMIQKELKKIKPELIASIKEEVLQELSQEGGQRVSVQEDSRNIVDGVGRPDNVYKPSVPPSLMDGFHYNGWIYYINEQNGRFLYKIRENGTDNRRLTDYTVDATYSQFSVRNGYIYVEDYDFNLIKIKL